MLQYVPTGRLLDISYAVIIEVGKGSSFCQAPIAARVREAYAHGPQLASCWAMTSLRIITDRFFGIFL